MKFKQTISYYALRDGYTLPWYMGMGYKVPYRREIYIYIKPLHLIMRLFHWIHEYIWWRGVIEGLWCFCEAEGLDLFKIESCRISFWIMVHLWLSGEYRCGNTVIDCTQWTEKHKEFAKTFYG